MAHPRGGDAFHFYTTDLLKTFGQFPPDVPEYVPEKGMKASMRTRNHHLKARGKTWFFRMDVPPDCRSEFGKAEIVETTRQRELGEARKVRDRKLSEYKKLFDAMRNRSSADIGKELGSLAAHRAAAADKAAALSVDPYLDALIDEIDQQALRGIPDNASIAKVSSARDAFLASDEGTELKARLDAYRGKLPWVTYGKQYLEASPIQPRTKTEYERAYKLADAGLSAMPEVTKQQVQLWVNDQCKDYNRDTVKKYVSALKRLREYAGLETEPFEKITYVSPVKSRTRQPWTKEELKQLLEHTEPDYMIWVIKIALHSGRRLKAISGMSYDPEKRMLEFPAVKREQTAAKIPCHPDIENEVKKWVAKPRSASRISSAFTAIKSAAGFTLKSASTTLKDAHSLRNNASIALSTAGAPNHVVNQIVGWSTPGMIGRYGSGGNPEDLRQWIEKLDWSDVFGASTEPQPPGVSGG